MAVVDLAWPLCFNASRLISGMFHSRKMGRTSKCALGCNLPGGAGMDFTRELGTFQVNLMELLEHEGAFVVIKGEDIKGPFDTYDDALTGGYEAFGPVPFLIKQVHRPEAEPVHYFSRDLPLCTS
jgi:hypothetical protein